MGRFFARGGIRIYRYARRFPGRVWRETGWLTKGTLLATLALVTYTKIHSFIPAQYDHDWRSWPSARLAAQRIDRASGADLAGLPAAETYGLLRAVPYAEDTESLRDRLYLNSRLDPDYLASMAGPRAEFFDWMAGSPTLAEAKANWDAASDEERLAWMRVVATRYSELMGHEPPTLVGIDLSMPTRLIYDEGIILSGVYSSARLPGWNPGALIMNTADEGGWNDFADTLATLVHETTHYHQLKLVNALFWGGIDKSDPRFEQARIFRYNFYAYAKPGAGEALDVYAAQPVELEAFQMGGRAERVAQRIEPAGDWSAPDPETGAESGAESGRDARRGHSAAARDPAPRDPARGGPGM